MKESYAANLESKLVALVQDLSGSPRQGFLVRTVQLSHPRHVTLILHHRQLLGDFFTQVQRLLLQEY